MLVQKYERLAEQTERYAGDGQAPPEEIPPARGNTGRADPLLDPMGRKDR